MQEFPIHGRAYYEMMECPHTVSASTILCFSDLSFKNLSGPVPKIYAPNYRIVGVGICVIFYHYLHFPTHVLMISNRLLSHSCLSGI
jgi:hypothetical protein